MKSLLSAGSRPSDQLDHNSSAKLQLKPLRNMVLNFIPCTSLGLSRQQLPLPSASLRIPNPVKKMSSSRLLTLGAASWLQRPKGRTSILAQARQRFLWHICEGLRSAGSAAPAGWSQPKAHVSTASPKQPWQGSADLHQPRSRAFELAFLRGEHRKTLSSRRVQSFATSKATWAARQEPEGCASVPQKSMGIPQMENNPARQSCLC